MLRPVVLAFTLLAPAIFWLEPFGPWVWSLRPPAAASAPDWMIAGPDTLRLDVYAWRDFMPEVVTGACGGAERHPAMLAVSFAGPAGSVEPPARVDSLWLLHGPDVLLDRDPAWEARYRYSVVLYEGLPEYPIGDTVAVLVSLRGASGGRFYLIGRAAVRMTI